MTGLPNTADPAKSRLNTAVLIRFSSGWGPALTLSGALRGASGGIRQIDDNRLLGGPGNRHADGLGVAAVGLRMDLEGGDPDEIAGVGVVRFREVGAGPEPGV